MSLLKSINLKIAEKLKDKEYRDQFFESWTHDEIATQLRNLRNRRDLRQVDVAATTGMKQSAISRLEQAEYSRWGFPTLLRIAQALDARVKVVFEPAEDVIRQYEKDEKEVQLGSSVANARQVDAHEARERHYEVSGHRLINKSIQREDTVPTARLSYLRQSKGLGR